MTKPHQNLFAALAVSAMASVVVGNAFAADGLWAREHPRRAEVNGRLANQHRRINQEVKEGEISGKQAAALHREDRQIRHEERAMASQNEGHITKSEQRTLNQQENAVSRQIGH